MIPLSYALVIYFVTIVVVVFLCRCNDKANRECLASYKETYKSYKNTCKEWSTLCDQKTNIDKLLKTSINALMDDLQDVNDNRKEIVKIAQEGLKLAREIKKEYDILDSLYSAAVKRIEQLEQGVQN